MYDSSSDQRHATPDTNSNTNPDTNSNTSPDTHPLTTPDKTKLIDGKLKRRVGSKYQKEAHFSQYQQYARDYCRATLSEIGLSPKDNRISVTDPRSGRSQHCEQFSPITRTYINKKGRSSIIHGLNIVYTDHKGQIYWSKNEEQKERAFCRFRFSAGLEWSDAKYLSDPGSGYFAYLNPIFQHFHSKGVTHLKRVYLVEGEKKAACAGVHGIPAVGAGGIHLFVKTIKDPENQQTIDAEFLPELKAFFQEYSVEEVVYIHDQDALDNLGKMERARSFYASVRNLYRACEKEGIRLIYKHIADTAPGKGLDDVINADADQLSQIQQALASDDHSAYFKSFCIAHDTANHDLARLYRYFLGSVHQASARLSLLVDCYAQQQQEKIFAVFDAHMRAALSARTGSGKTDLSYRYAAARIADPTFKGRIIFCYPNNLSSEQKAIQYSEAEQNPSGLQLDICLLNQYTSPEEKAWIHQRRIINCHASRLQELCPGKQDIIFFDEAHKTFVDNYEDTVANMEYLLSCRAKTIFLTGTEFREFYQALDIFEIEVLRRVDPAVSIHFNELSRKGKRSFNLEQQLNLYAAEAIRYVESLDPNAEQVHILFIKSVDRIKQLSELLAKRGIATARLYADADIKANSHIWESLVKHGRIPTQGKALVILTTPLLYESADIKNTNIGRVAVFGEEWPHNIRQIAGRFRNCKQLRIDYFLTAADRRTGYYKSCTSYRKEHYSDFVRLREIYDQYNALITAKQANTYQQQQKYIVEANEYLRQDGRFNEFRCVRNWIRERNRYLSNQQRLDELSRFFALEQEPIQEAYHCPEMEQVQQAVKQQRQADKALAFAKVKENLQYALFLVSVSKVDAPLRAQARQQLRMSPGQIAQDPHYLAWQEGIHKKVKGHIIRIVSYYLYLADYMQDETAMLSLIEGNYTEFNSNVKQQIAILQVLDGVDPSPVDKVNRHLYESVIQRFDVGERYSPAQIRERIHEVFSDYEHFKVPGKHVTHFFRMLFVAKRDRKGCYKISKRKCMQHFCRQDQALSVPPCGTVPPKYAPGGVPPDSVTPLH